jgi:hypothetical protein
MFSSMVFWYRTVLGGSDSVPVHFHNALESKIIAVILVRDLK